MTKKMNQFQILKFTRIQPFRSDDFSSLGKVSSRHATGSVNCENSSVPFVMKYCPTSTVFSGILYQYKSLSNDLVVEAFPLVPSAAAIDFLEQEFQLKVSVSLPINLLARNVDQIALPIRVSLFLLDSCRTLHTSPRLIIRY